MRTAFLETLCERAEQDPGLWLLTGDLGFSVLEPFAERFPERYVNVGVAEQNMAGIAAGLALAGNRVVIYSIVNFATLRCLEQIRNDIVYHRAPVMVVGVGGGYAYGAQGYTHHGLEDLPVMASLPGMNVAAPGDPAETRAVFNILLDRQAPAYLRLGKAGEPLVHAQTPALRYGEPLSVREGSAALILSTGGLLSEAVTAADRLAAKGCEVAVWSLPWISPFPHDAIAAAAERFPLILTCEEGQGRGGLAGAAALACAGRPGSRAMLRSAAAPSDQIAPTMSQAAARARYRLDADGLVERIEEALAECG